jgi:hypothetical protein
MNRLKNILNTKNLTSTLLVFLFPFIFQLGLTYLFLNQFLISDQSTQLTSFVDRINNDIRYYKGKWDLSLYNSDPLTPYPNSSSTFPVYVITSDGFVIERSKPINGILDKSDFKHLSQFNTPQNLNSVTNETWRVLSEPVSNFDSKIIGVILVSYYNPDPSSTSDIDQKLKDTISKLKSELIFKGDLIDASKVDIRNTNYDVSFEIVDTFNEVIINNGRTPSFIDPSYVKDALNYKGERVVQDLANGQEYLLDYKPIADKNNSTVGIIVSGVSIEPNNNILKAFIISSLLICLFITFPLIFIALYFFNHHKNKFSKRKQLEDEKNTNDLLSSSFINLIRFDPKESILLINDKRYEIVKDTNQYYLLKALINSPKKNWSNDELLELFGEEPNKFNSRKVYDSMLAINKKLDIKLIDYHGKTFSINKEYQKLLLNKPLKKSEEVY